MTRAALNWILDSNHKRRWIAAGVVLVGLAGLRQEPQGAAGVRTPGSVPVRGARYQAGWVNGGAGAAASDDVAGDPVPASGPTAETGFTAPQPGGFVSPATAASEDDAPAPSSGDSVPESVNTNFSDYLRGQQRVVSENDGQTYIVDSNTDPHQMTDTRDSVSSFSAAAPGSEAAGYAEVAPSGATTVDTSTSTPVDTGSAASAGAGE